MDSRIAVERVWLSENGRRINYAYRATGRAARYFAGQPVFYARYEVDLEGVPESILAIPLLANLAPIAWFADVELHVASVDSDFLSALQEVAALFGKHYPGLVSGHRIHAGRVEQSRIEGGRTALLFSGGLDSYESLIRHLDEHPFLISALGADIDISDARRWQEFKKFNSEQPIVAQMEWLPVESNLRDFYTLDVDLLVGTGWWGKVQHGMGLLGICAPLSFKLGFDELLIASSNTQEVDFGWGSQPGVDEKVRWAGLRVGHDGYHLRRTDKMANVVRFGETTGENVKLRVCYSEHRSGRNCNRCPKCLRTMLALLLEDADPDAFGFDVPEDMLSLVLANFPAHGTRMTAGVRYEWKCLQEKARSLSRDARLASLHGGSTFLQTFTALDMDVLVDVSQRSVTRLDRLKFVITKKFPNTFRAYLALRNMTGGPR